MALILRQILRQNAEDLTFLNQIFAGHNHYPVMKHHILTTETTYTASRKVYLHCRTQEGLEQLADDRGFPPGYERFAPCVMLAADVYMVNIPGYGVNINQI